MKISQCCLLKSWLIVIVSTFTVGKQHMVKTPLNLPFCVFCVPQIPPNFPTKIRSINVKGGGNAAHSMCAGTQRQNIFHQKTRLRHQSSLWWTNKAAGLQGWKISLPFSTKVFSAAAFSLKWANFIGKCWWNTKRKLCFLFAQFPIFVSVTRTGKFHGFCC